MNEMVDRVAKAIFDWLKNPTDDKRSSRTCIDGDFDLHPLARAAIEAMREPTEAMESMEDGSARAWRYLMFVVIEEDNTNYGPVTDLLRPDA